MTWLLEDGLSGGLDLLYRVSQYVWKKSYFYDKCDNKGETVTVIPSTFGFIFGRFSDKPWTYTNIHCKSDKVIFFYLKSP